MYPMAREMELNTTYKITGVTDEVIYARLCVDT